MATCSSIQSQPANRRPSAAGAVIRRPQLIGWPRTHKARGRTDAQWAAMSVASALPLAVCLLLLPTFTDGKGEVWIRLVQYRNKYGQDAKKDHCDSSLFGRTSDCDFYFKFSMSGPTGISGPRWNAITTGLYRDKNTVNFGNTFNGGDVNPRGGLFDKWNNRLRYQLVVWDDDHLTGDDHVDTVVHEVNLAADGRERTYYHHGIYHGHNTEFVFKAMAKCAVFFYGSDCKLFCFPYDTDEKGHYFCDSYGNKACRPGWRDKSTDCKTRDYCHTQPCKNGGRCENLASNYRCECTTWYDGTNCERRRTPCEVENRCVNGGKCVNVGDTAQCSCPPQWKGPTCAEDRNECLGGTPCENNGTCINERGGFRCNCTFGFAGANCSSNVNECQVSANRSVLLCQNGGTCVDTHGSFSCLCPPQFEGPTCEKDKNECLNPQQCSNRGNCTNTFGGFKCACPPQFEGPRCRTDVNECIGRNPCQNNGTCSNTVGGFKCICPIGWHGAACEIDEDECATGAVKCLYGGTCVNTNGSAYCVCPKTRNGTRCEEDSDECAGENPCQNGGTCENLKDSTLGYLCKCNGTGYQGRSCTVDVDECDDEKEAGDKQFCGKGGSCRNIKGSFICNCKNSTHDFDLEGMRCPLSIEKKTDSLTSRARFSWVSGVVVGFLLVILVVLAFFAYRRRHHLKDKLPDVIKAKLQKNNSSSSMRYKKDSETTEAEFDNQVYAPDPNDPDDLPVTSGDFDNQIYAHRRTSQQNLVQNDACDSAHYATLQNAGTLPTRGVSVGGVTLTMNGYVPSESNDATDYDSTMQGYDNYGSSGYPYGLNPEPQVKILPQINDDEEEELSAEEAIEDEDNYAQLPGDVYSSLSRPRSEAEYYRPQSIAERSPSPLPLPPPLPPRGGVGEDSTV